jgi:hypothetical protein
LGLWRQNRTIAFAYLISKNNRLAFPRAETYLFLTTPDA